MSGRPTLAAFAAGVGATLVGVVTLVVVGCPCGDCRAVTRARSSSHASSHAAHAPVTPLGIRAGQRVGKGLTAS